MNPNDTLSLGGYVGLGSLSDMISLELPTKHLLTHGVIVGMTGSGKTGLLMVTVEEALRERVPVLMIDVKGDLPNLLLAFPSFDPAEVAPWLEASDGESSEERAAREAAAARIAKDREEALTAWAITETDLAAFHESVAVRVLTPGSSAGEPLHVLSSLERRSTLWDTDPESARASLSSAISLLLRLVGRDADPAKSREHVVLSVFAERRLLANEPADVGALMKDLAEPPIHEIGALTLDAYMSKRARGELAATLNSLLASPTFASWRQGAALDVASWMKPVDGRTPATIVSVAHLDDEERTLVLGMLLEEVLSWVRTLPGSQKLRALVVFDEVYGFLPPHPAAPPTKRPIVALMKQARAFGVGVMIATQNPMDLDYRALSNAGLWCIGRLQTDADRARVIEGLQIAGARDETDLDDLVQRLTPRWFLVRDAHSSEAPVLLQPRYAMSFLRGPMTRHEIRRARALREGPPSAMGESTAED